MANVKFIVIAGLYTIGTNQVYVCIKESEFVKTEKANLNLNYSEIYKFIYDYCTSNIINYNKKILYELKDRYDFSKIEDKLSTSINDVTLNLTLNLASPYGINIHANVINKNKKGITMVERLVEVCIYRNSTVNFKSSDYSDGEEILLKPSVGAKNIRQQLMSYTVNWFGRNESFIIFKTQKRKLDKYRDKIRNTILRRFSDKDFFDEYGSNLGAKDEKEFSQKLADRAQIILSYVTDKAICKLADIDEYSAGYFTYPTTIVIIKSYACYILVEITVSGEVYVNDIYDAYDGESGSLIEDHRFDANAINKLLFNKSL